MANGFFLALIWALNLVVISIATIRYDPFYEDTLADIDNTSKPSVPDQSSESDYDDLMKRWYSLPLRPPTGVNDPNPLTAYPWPPTCGGNSWPAQTWLRYCFQDPSSAHNLLEVLMGAIARWVPAEQDSSFRIRPDFACEGDWYCLCSHRGSRGQTVNTDALKIWDGMIDADHKNRKWDTRATVGYQYGSNTPWRHWMIFAVYNNQDPNSLSFDRAVHTMTHELGHAAGLLHEHQRPDRDNFVNVEWKNIDGYDEAAEKVAAVTDGTFDAGADKHDRMDQVIQYGGLIQKYFPEATCFAPEQYFSILQPYRQSQPFDFDSIMIYGSTYGARKGTRVLTRKVPQGGSILIQAGGNPYYALTGISDGDHQRIKQLYPATIEPDTGIPRALIRAANSTPAFTSQWKPVSVSIPHLLATEVRRPPPYTPSDVAVAESQQGVLKPDFDLVGWEWNDTSAVSPSASSPP